MAAKRLRIGVLFGGRSAEHEVSVLSATNVMAALEPAKYDAVPIFVTREGQWLLSHFEDGVLAKPSDGTQLCLVPGGHGRMLAIPAKGAPHDLPDIDILFPVLHGLHGEDGSVQGLAEVARVPLAGCGILGSAAALDKDIAKRLLRAAGVPVARSVTIEDGAAPSLAVLEDELGLPLFIKPARQGSSVGVAKVNGSQEFEPALAEAFQHDRKLLAEEFIRGREIEFSVLERPDRRTLRLAAGRDRAGGKPRLLQLQRQIHRRERRGIEGAGASCRRRSRLPCATWRQRRSGPSVATPWRASTSS